MGRSLNFVVSGEAAPLADGGLRFSKTMLVEKIEEHEDFKRLFRIDDGVLGRITEAMRSRGFDNSQPVHIWHTCGNDGEHWYLIDGYTRFTACKKAGITRIPVYEHEFGSFAETYKYVLSLQVNRRNLSGDELLKNVAILLDSDEVCNYDGDKAEKIADSLGISKRTAQRAISLRKNGDNELLESVRSGELSVNKAYNRLQKERREGKPKSFSGKKAASENMYSAEEVRNLIQYVLLRVADGFSITMNGNAGYRYEISDKERMTIESMGFSEEKNMEV